MVRFVIPAITFLLALPTGVMATGLIWNLPEAGQFVTYEGTYKQETVNPQSTDGNSSIEWIRNLTIKSLGKVDAEYNGKVQPCRWIELKVVTGNRSETGVDPGPAGARLYKVLVPESKVIGNTVDADSIPVSMIPIVKGYRRTGEGAVTPIKAKALQIYPSLSLLTHYQENEVVAGSETPDVQAGTFESRHLKGQVTIERPTTRVKNTADFWVSKEIPFGLVKWKVTDRRETKDLTDSREDFKEATKVVVEMAAQRVGDGATSEIAEQ
jgi:hypothetical protein